MGGSRPFSPIFGGGLLALVLAAGGCRLFQQPPPDPWAPRKARLLGTYRILREGRFLGRLRELEIPDRVRPTRLRLVENQWGQWVGWIDATGRAFALKAFEKEPVLVYTGSLEDCVKVLMGLDEPPSLEKEKAPEKDGG